MAAARSPRAPGSPSPARSPGSSHTRARRATAGPRPTASSGRSPRVKSASLQPNSAPRRATSRISSGSMYMPMPCGAQLAGHRDEGAVVAGVAAQVRHRDEHLARVADRKPSGRPPPARSLQPGVAHPSGAGAQVGEIVAAGGHRDRGFVDVERDPVARPPQHPPQRGGTRRARASAGPPGWADRSRAGGSEPLPCNPGVIENHPRVSHSETTCAWHRGHSSPRAATRWGLPSPPRSTDTPRKLMRVGQTPGRLHSMRGSVRDEASWDIAAITASAVVPR